MTDDEIKNMILVEVDKAVEKAVLLLPEVMSNLLQEKVAMQKLAKEFYAANKDFNAHKDIVGTTLEELETAEPGKQYKEILDKATPIIKKRIKDITLSDITNTTAPTNLTLNNGVL